MEVVQLTPWTLLIFFFNIFFSLTVEYIVCVISIFNDINGGIAYEYQIPHTEAQLQKKSLSGRRCRDNLVHS